MPKQRDPWPPSRLGVHAAMQSASMLRAAAQTPAVPTFEAIRKAIPSACFERSTAKGLLALLVVVSLFVAATILLYTAQSWPVLVAATIARGLTIGLVFIVGHDACHDSLTPHTWLNRLIGQLAFLPSYHTFTGWRYAHNFVHHQHTQILERDTGYPPLTPEQYAALPTWRRARYRAARTPLGAGLLYAPLWWRDHIFPTSQMRSNIRTAGKYYAAQQGFIALWFSFELALFGGVFALSGLFTATHFPPFVMLLFGIVATQCVWNTQMGIVTFLHHSHPHVAWHSEASAPPAAQRQLEATVHIAFPAHTHWSMLNIFEHTAHHVAQQIPLYNLPRAQAALNKAFVRYVQREPLTWRSVGVAFATCKLWNGEAKKWVGF